MFRLRVAVALFIAWVFMFLLTIETRSVMFEIMMPVIMMLLVVYLLVWSIVAIVDSGKNNQNGPQDQNGPQPKE
jgi:high-affinity Fe2+/Pb2+ permease